MPRTTLRLTVGAAVLCGAAALTAQGAVQVNTPPPKPATGSVTVNQPPVGGAHTATPNVVHCMDGTTEPKSPPMVMRISPYCEHHGGVNDKPTQVGVAPAAPTGSVAVTTPPVGSHSNKNTVPCNDGTWEPPSAVNQCQHHGGMNHKNVSVGTTRSPTGSVAVNAAPVGGSAGAHTTTSAHMIPCKDGTMQPNIYPPCAHNGGPNPAPVHVGTTGTTTAGAAPSSATHTAPPAGATAHCKDGTYSMATHKTGACADHGGVGSWLVKGLPD